MRGVARSGVRWRGGVRYCPREPRACTWRRRRAPGLCSCSQAVIPNPAGVWTAVRDLLLLSPCCASRRSFRGPSETNLRRVVALDEPQLPFASPRFDLLFPGDCGSDVAEDFVMHQAEDFVSRRKARDAAFAVFNETPSQAVRHARVEVTRAARENVDAVGSAHLGFTVTLACANTTQKRKSEKQIAKADP
jgi:hypothetical protein